MLQQQQQYRFQRLGTGIYKVIRNQYDSSNWVGQRKVRDSYLIIWVLIQIKNGSDIYVFSLTFVLVV